MNVIKTKSRQYGTFSCDVFWLGTEQGGEIAITRAHPNDKKAHRVPLVFLPGMFSNRRFWLSDKGIGFAAYLCDQGYECWMIERRGIGESSRQDYKTASLMQCIRYDLPAVQALVASENKRPAFWVGHSFGGVLTASSLAQGYLKAEQVAGLMNFSSQLTIGKHFLNPPLSASIFASTALLGYFPAKSLKMGPENEPPETMRDCVRLVSWAKTDKQDNFWKGFNDIKVPVLAFGSEGDTVDPYPGCQYLLDKIGSDDKLFILLGKSHGHRQDYDHVGMVVSRDAQGEIWPAALQWLDNQRLYGGNTP